MRTHAARLLTAARNALRSAGVFLAGSLPTLLLGAILMAGRPQSEPARPRLTEPATRMTAAVADGTTTTFGNAAVADVPPAVLALHARFERVPAPAPTARDSAALEAALPADALHEPLADYFRRFSDNEVIVRRVTRAVIRYSQERDLAPSLVAAVLVTENRTLTPRAASPVGAQGLMQVMPFHAGMRGCPSSDLTNVENNICHGTGILARDLGRSANTRKALLRYNGCVKGTNTPNCSAYPAQVLHRASRIRREILTSATMAWAPVPAIAHDGELLAVSTR